MVHTADDVLTWLEATEPSRARLATAARRRVLLEHTAAHRAAEFERAIRKAQARRWSEKRGKMAIEAA